MKPNQVNVAALAVLRKLQQVLDTFKTRLDREPFRDLPPGNRIDGIDDNVSFVHAIPAADLDMRMRPEADGVSDAPALDCFAKMPGENQLARDVTAGSAAPTNAALLRGARGRRQRLPVGDT